jgi:hypothetical protein
MSIDLLITPAPKVMVPTYFGVAMPPGVDLLFDTALIMVSFFSLAYFGWEFVKKWKQYRETTKYIKEEDKE